MLELAAQVAFGLERLLSRLGKAYPRARGAAARKLSRSSLMIEGKGKAA